MIQMVRIKGKRYALVEPAELRRLKRLAALSEQLPAYPPADASGKRPAAESATIAIARGIVRRRQGAGLTQQDLAHLAGVRHETICRIESGKHYPTVRTAEKIEKALVRAARTKKKIR